MSEESIYTRGTLIWLPCEKSVWKCVELVKLEKTEIHYKENEKIEIFKSNAPPHLRNPEILIGNNDLTSLSYLHEPAVLYNLNQRFNLNTIYTYCGIVLVAINPYEELDIYNKETIQVYRGRGDLDPHIFAVAEEAYNKMERDNRNQSIIVSGESGAGKTVSAKYAMRYFATVGGSENETQIERKVLASSPIMEAIGNAKTTRNDNSSRFGKYVELHFNKQYQITGASMRTYLLEKSRVVYQSPEERNYHIFYQICSGRSSHPELSELFLEDCNEFNYTKSDQNYQEQKYLGDLQNFSDTVEALTLLGFGIDNRRNFFKVFAALLQLGNVPFVATSDTAHVPKDSSSLEKFTNLLTINPDTLRKSLVTRQITSGREIILKQMTIQESTYSRDALAKLLYSELFNLIVTGINDTLLKYYDEKTVHKFIGVLDIYGFETFEFNSFEQFCINYANEKLQQQFNQHVFKLEQEEYIREGIEWTMIDFYDNQPCIDLIESKLGILDLLDEECRMPQGSDQTWVLKLHNKCGNSKHFVKPKIGGEKQFIIKHFADDVNYTCTGFIEKNRDSLPLELIQCVADSKNPFITSLLQKKLKTVTTTKSKSTVGSQFIESLKLLMTSLNATTPHYIRCIKPNDQKLPFVFDSHRAVQQLRACGVLETIRISAAGFPSRWSYLEFNSRYKMLGIKSKKPDLKSNCEFLIQKLINNEDNYRLGKTKIFFRAGQVAYLEKLRLEKLQKSGLIVQKLVRGYAKKRIYKKVRKSCELLQNYARGLSARKQARFYKETKAVIIIQSFTRMFLAKRKFVQIVGVIKKLQAISRGYIVRNYVDNLRKTNAALMIQKNFRGYLGRRKAYKKKMQIILGQSCIRRYLARKRLRLLKLEARSLEHVKQLNKGLENKIISLQQKIEEISKENSQLKHLKTDFVNLKSQMENVKVIEKELKNLNTKYSKIEKENETLRVDIEREVSEKIDVINEKEKVFENFKKLEKIIKILQEEKNSLENENFELIKSVNVIEELKNKNEQLENEIELERVKYQDFIARGFASEEGQKPVPLPRSNIYPKPEDQLRLQELEMENSKLKQDMTKLRSTADVSSEIKNQFELLQNELERKKEESLQLRAFLNDKSNSVINDSHAKVISNLQSELTSSRKETSKLQSEYNSQLEKMRKENIEKTNLLMSKKDVDPHLKSEINRLTSENNNLRIMVESLQPNKEDLIDRRISDLVVKKKNRVYLGMLEYKNEDINRILRSIIVDLHPSVALSTELSTFPALIIFMLIRYTDYLNDDDRVRSLLTLAISNIKKTIRKKGENLDVIILWLTNILRLLHTLKQYSGDVNFQLENTPKQNEQALKNFDLSEYRQVLSDHAVWVYMLLIKNLEDSIQSLIVPAILENSGIELPGQPPLTNNQTQKNESKPLEALTRFLDQTFNLLVSYNLDMEVVHQVFKQIFYYICAGALNNLLLRRELCHWSKGLEIRFNVSTLEEWCREKKMDEVPHTMAPVIQASQLLQARKLDNDVQSLCDISEKLTIQQVVKLLNLYSSKDGLDTDKVSKTLISKVQAQLTEMRKSSQETTKSSLLMDTKFSFAVKFPFNPSHIKLEEIVIPDVLGINSFVKRL